MATFLLGFYSVAGAAPDLDVVRWALVRNHDMDFSLSGLPGITVTLLNPHLI